MKPTKTQNKQAGRGRRWLLATLLALLVSPCRLSAQITIGDGTEPKAFSILEIISNQKRGLRMPHLTTDERDVMVATANFQSNVVGLAKGLTIYNTTTDCMEFWNGEKWISTCEGEATPVLFDPIYNVDSGTTSLNLDVVFVQGTGDDKTRGTGVSYSAMAVGVFRYTGATGQAFGGVTTTVKGITVTIPATTLANGAGELTISVSGTPTAVTAGRAFDIPITVLGQQLYVRVHVGCGGYTSIQYTAIPKTIPSTEGDPAWQQFQCFNLGADTSLNDPFTYVSNGDDIGYDIKGDLYQWGCTTDGHQLRNSAITVLTTQLTTTDPGTSDFLFYGLANTQVWTSSPDFFLLWGDGSTVLENSTENPAKGVNDPCPSGWKVPSMPEWDNLMAASRTNNVWAGNGYKIGNNLYIPAAGYRDGVFGTGTPTDIGIKGRYWTSLTYGNNYYGANGLYIDSSGPSILQNARGGDGYSVRCMAE